MKHIILSKTLNTRDIGGYTANGKDVKYGRIFRSDVILAVTDQDINILSDHNITDLIDLRKENELITDPCPLIYNNIFKYHHCPLHSGILPPEPLKIPALYIEMISSFRVVREFFRIIKNSKGGVLYFCKAGKDRTGVMTSLILMLAGIDEDDIIKEYMLSHHYLLEKIKSWEDSHPNFPKGVVAPRKEYMQNFLFQFKEKYQSIQNYLLHIGLDENEIEHLRIKILN